MDAANIDSLLQRASVIKNETMDKANTAQRVGSLLYDIIDICDELAKEMFSLGNGTGGTGGGGGGSVGSVGLQMPEGFTVSGSPVTGNGTLKVALASGFYLLTELQRRGLHTHDNQSFLDLLSVAYDGFTKYIKWTDEGKLKVAEAAKLSVAHEIFGNLFDGTQDVKGELKNVTNITASGTVKGNAADFVNVITKNLRVLGKAEFFNLVLQKISSVGGSWIISPADPFQIGWFEPSADGSRYVLYWRANDADGVLSQNTWMVRDQAICQNFNKATSKGVSNNTYWWSVVLAVSSSPVTKSVYGGENIDDEGNKYHYIEVANDAEGSELCDGDLVPVLGDTVSHLGHRFTQTEIDSGDADYSRQAAVAFGACNTIDNGYTPGPGEEGKAIGRLVPPFFATYRGIADFNLGKYRRTYLDANESRFVGDVEIVSDRGIVPFATFVEDSIGKAQFNTFYKYSSHADGSGMCDDTSLEYRGVCVTTSASAPSEFSKYAWTKNPKDGKDGKDGTDGKDGADGKDGENGADAVTFDIIPSLDKLNFTRSADGSLVNSTKQISIDVKKTVGATVEILTVANSGLRVRYSLTGMPVSATAGYSWPTTANASGFVGITISASTAASNSAVYVAAFNSDGTLVDRETIPILKDGAKGADGADGTNGRDGQDGADGSTPYIVNGYWWIDGRNTGVKAEGVDGKDGTNGKDGSDGFDGVNGVSAIQFTCSPSEVVFNTDASGKITVTQGVTIAVTRDGGAVTKSYGSLSSVNCQATRSGDTVTIDATWKTANAGYYEQVTAVDGATYYIAPTSGSVTVPVTVEGRTYRIVIPWRTNLMATFKYFKSDVDKFLSSYQAYVANNDRNIEVMRSDIQQSADKIILAVEKMREVTVGNNYFKDCNWDFSTRWTPTLASNSTHNVVASGVGMASSLYVYNILNDGATSAKTINPEYGTNFAYIYGYRKPNTDSVLYTHISPRLPDGTTGRLFVPKGKYTFSARCLTNRREWLAPGGIQIELFRGKNDANRYNFVPINSRPSANGVWEDSSVTFDVPEDSYVDILFGLFLQSTAGTTTSTANRTYLLIDCLQLESGPEFTGWSSRHTLAEKLYRSGIDIEAERIKLTSDNIECVNNEGEETLRIDKHGNPTFAGAIQQTIQDIDVADGKNTYLLIDTVSNEVPIGLNSIPFTSASCYCLDVWKCANVVHIRNCDRNILLPFYIYGRWYRTQVADDEGNKRWIDKEDLLKLVGKKLIIYAHPGSGQNYLYYGIATPQLDTDGIVYRTPSTGMVGMQINVEQTLILEFVHAFYKGSSGSTIYEGFFWKGRIGSTEDIDNEAGWYFE